MARARAINGLAMRLWNYRSRGCAERMWKVVASHRAAQGASASPGIEPGQPPHLSRFRQEPVGDLLEVTSTRPGARVWADLQADRRNGALPAGDPRSCLPRLPRLTCRAPAPREEAARYPPGTSQSIRVSQNRHTTSRYCHLNELMVMRSFS